MEQGQREVTSVLATVSVTFPGAGQRPMVSSRVVIDGTEAEVPFALVLGSGEQPIQVVSIDTAEDKLDYAMVFQRLSAGLTEVLLRGLKQQSGGSAEEPAP